MNKYKEQKLNTMIDLMKESYGSVDKKLVDFIDKLESYRFFLNLEEFDLDYAIENPNHMSLPILISRKISIGIDNIYADQVRIGIDPSYCFNKIGDCSIIAHFPMSKREYKRFIVLFEKLLSESGNKNLKKEWLNSANTCWCGAFTTFGE